MFDSDRFTTQPGELADVFAEVARTLLAEDDTTAVLGTMTRSAVDTIGSAQHCGIAVVGPGEVRMVAASDEVPVGIARLQEASGQGPCLDAIREHEIFRTGDLTAEHDRWPDLARRAAQETPVRSMVAFRLFAGDRTMGVMSLYSAEVDAFDESDVHVGSVFAAHAAVAMSNTVVIDSLRCALETRDRISTAKGVLMGRDGISEDDAFAMLRRASQHENVKLRDIADRIVAQRRENQG